MSNKFSNIVKNIESQKVGMTIMPTGFKMLDKYLDGGFLKKELIVLGGPTASGKSLLGGKFFHNIVTAGFKSAYFSLEISNEMIVSRLMGSVSNVKPARIMMPSYLEESEKDRIGVAKAEIGAYEKLMTFYDDLYQLSDIVKEIKENDFEFVVIDFIQNVMLNKRDEYERMSFVSLTLQGLAKKTDTCILVLSQLSNVMSREKKTDIIEYKGSGSIGMVADLGFFIEKSDAPGAFYLRLRKNRRGVAGEAFGFMIKSPGGDLLLT